LRCESVIAQSGQYRTKEPRDIPGFWWAPGVPNSMVKVVSHRA
jgi:hypothetical protein